MKKPHLMRKTLVLSCLFITFFVLGGCKEDPVANTEPPKPELKTVKISPLPGYWKAKVTIPFVQINIDIDLILSEQPNKEVRGSGYALFDIPAGLLGGGDPNQEIPFKLAQPLANCSAAFNADSTVMIDAGVLDLALLGELLGGGGGGGFLQSLPLKMQKATLSADKKSISGSIQFLIAQLPVVFVKQ